MVRPVTCRLNPTPLACPSSKSRAAGNWSKVRQRSNRTHPRRGALRLAAARRPTPLIGCAGGRINTPLACDAPRRGDRPSLELGRTSRGRRLCQLTPAPAPAPGLRRSALLVRCTCCGSMSQKSECCQGRRGFILYPAQL